jgi:aspartate/methionine/tyrosine aminotransferase
MQDVRKYINHGAKPDSIILGASNPILPAPKFILDAGASAFYHAQDIYTNVREPHQEDGNMMRYYSSRADRGITILQKNLYEFCESEGFDIRNLKFFVTNSLLSGIVPAFCSGVLKRGDTVLLTKPTYGPFFSNLHNRGMNIKMRDLDASTNWKITPDILQGMLDEAPDAKVFFMINPGNPMGEVYSKQELEGLSKVIVKHNENREEKLLVFSDEVARNLILGDTKFVSIGSLPGMADCTYTSWSLSKDIGGPGIGCAVAIAHKDLIERTRVDDAGPSYPVQVAAAEAFALSRQPEIIEHCQTANVIYKRNIRQITNWCEETNYKLNRHLYSSEGYQNLIYPMAFPEGGFQLPLQAKGLLGLRFPHDYIHRPNPDSKYIESSLDLAWYLRERAKVEFIPGEGFGFSGDSMVFRTTFGKRDTTLEKAFKQVDAAIMGLELDRDREAQDLYKLLPVAPKKPNLDDIPPSPFPKTIEKSIALVRSESELSK